MNISLSSGDSGLGHYASAFRVTILDLSRFPIGDILKARKLALIRIVRMGGVASTH